MTSAPATSGPLGPGTRVLITNNTLSLRAGTELVVRDLALALLRRGHHPVAYSSVLGDVAHELERHGVPVVDDLDRLGEAPDVIHGQHHLDAMTAMLRFPSVPALYVCHGWLPWEERPPVFPSIRRYVAVDDLCLERLTTTAGIDVDRTQVVRNAVDVDRFRPRGPLPSRPTSALVFSNEASAGGYASVIADACRELGVERVDVVGRGVGRSLAEPESVLGDYDIVFAKGRAALEAMAVGCAAVVAAPEGLGGLVTSSGLDQMRRYNFGLRLLQSSRVTPESVRAALVAYDPDDAARVSARIRGEATLEQAVDQWEQVYADVLAEGDVAVDPDAALSAASRYLRSLAEVVKDRTIADVRASQLTHEWATAESGRSAALDGLARTGAELARTQEELGLVIDGLEAEIAAQRDRQTTLEASRAWRISTSLWRANARIRNPRGPR